jgi:hypothetical protein
LWPLFGSSASRFVRSIEMLFATHTPPSLTVFDQQGTEKRLGCEATKSGIPNPRDEICRSHGLRLRLIIQSWCCRRKSTTFGPA